MTHGEDTAKKYYRHVQGIAASVHAYEVTAGGLGVKRKASDEEEEEKENYYQPKIKKRMKWMPEEDEKIKNNFDVMQKTPTLEQCAAFLEKQKEEDTN